MRAASFTRRGAIVVAGLVAVSMAATMFLSVYGDAMSAPSSAAPDSFSRSALGHHAFLELVRRDGRAVVVSRSRTAEKAAAGAPTALLEPRIGHDEASEGRLDEIASAARRLLLVLPKRDGIPSFRPRGWLEHAGILPPDEIDGVLAAADLDASVFRPARTRANGERWTGSLPGPELQDLQLLRSEELTPLLATEDGILVGEMVTEDRHLVVVADPDVFATHGLGRGRNAELAIAVLDRLGGERTLVVDETVHGWELDPSLVQELLRFPLVLATLQAAVTLGLLAWAALVRFGRPVAETPLLRAGKDFLVANVADLLRAGGHAHEAARAYLRATREEVLARIPPPGGPETPDAWLRRLEAARGRAGTLASLERQVAALAERRRGAEVEAVRAARRIQRWREELTHGAAGDPREARGRPG